MKLRILPVAVAFLAISYSANAQKNKTADVAEDAADRAKIQRDGSPSSAQRNTGAGAENQQNGANAGNSGDWDKAKETQMELSEAPQSVRDSIKTASGNKEADTKIVRLNKDGQVLYRAAVSQENQQEMHVYVQENGTVKKMKQKIKFENAPLDVRTSVGKRLGGSDKQPDEIYRVIEGQETTYMAKAKDSDGKPMKIHVNSMGGVISPTEPIKKAPSGRPGNTGTPDNSKHEPAAVDPAAPSEPEGSGRPGNTGTVGEED